MSTYNYRAAFANSTSRLQGIADHFLSLSLQNKESEVAQEMVQIAACSTLKGVEQKSIAIALIIAKWCEECQIEVILKNFDFSKLKGEIHRQAQVETLVRCAGQAYAVRQWATLSVKVKA